MRILLLCALFSVHINGMVVKELYQSRKGTIKITSDAILEFIEAESRQLRGVIEDSGKFAFIVEVQSFEGFNSPLQKEHFKENYMEVNQFPTASFTGKIIENIDFDKDGEQIVRVKGKLTIHGIKRERIIKAIFKKKGNKIHVRSFFSVLLKEHNINIPRIVNQKIAEEIQVSVEATLKKK